MNRPTLPLLLATLALLGTAPPAGACGPIRDTAYFTFRTHPDAPFEPFAAGQLGILRPSYARSYLAVSYRHLQGIPTSAEDQASVVELWNHRLRIPTATDSEGDPVRAWLDARAVVADQARDLEALDSLNAFHPLEGYYYWNFLNCPSDAFHTATETLGALTERHGARNAHVREWVRGQDQVFANCDGQVRTVPVVEASRAGFWSRAPQEFRQHRAYQIAAAHFYAGEYDDAHRRFLAIAGDRTSPWSELAPYLAARALVRKGMLASGEAVVDAEALAAAEQQIEAVLVDPGRAGVHAPARALLRYVRLYLHPEPQVHALAASIVAPTDGVPLGAAVDDYTRLLERFLEWNRYQGLDPSADDLTDWIITFQTGGDAARTHAVARWHETYSTAWLIAALSSITADHPERDSLIELAHQLDSTDPGFDTARFHTVRLLVEAGRDAEARGLADEVLAREDLPRSARNRFLDQRLALATDLDDVVSLLPRTPMGIGEDEQWAAHDRAGAEQPVLVGASGALLLQQLPLSQIAAIAGREELPAGVRLNIARAGWVRAALIGDGDLGVPLAQELISLDPTLVKTLEPYVVAGDDEQRKHAALHAILLLPGLRPAVEGGIPRAGAWSEIDSFRDNWWCIAGGHTDTPPPTFLTPEQVAERDRERQRLPLDTAPNYLCREAVTWAAADPGDSRVPEALHRAVKATRYGCTDEDTGRWSKEAFQILHREYPDSPWTAETPYWYK